MIAFGSQGTEHGPRSLGMQLGAEAGFGNPNVEATAGAAWFQSHGLAVGGHLDLGVDAAYRYDTGRFGGRVGLGGFKLADDVIGQPMLVLEANGAGQIKSDHCPVNVGPANDGAWGTSFSVSLSLRINARGWAIALSPRIAKYTHNCPFLGT